MKNTLTDAKFEFKGQIKFYRGKVRDVYYLKDDYIVMVVSDRISAFDHVMPRGIPYKGQILNQIAIEMMKKHQNMFQIGLFTVPTQMFL